MRGEIQITCDALKSARKKSGFFFLKHASVYVCEDIMNVMEERNGCLLCKETHYLRQIQRELPLREPIMGENVVVFYLPPCCSNTIIFLYL